MKGVTRIGVCFTLLLWGCCCSSLVTSQAKSELASVVSTDATTEQNSTAQTEISTQSTATQTTNTESTATQSTNTQTTNTETTNTPTQSTNTPTQSTNTETTNTPTQTTNTQSTNTQSTNTQSTNTQSTTTQLPECNNCDLGKPCNYSCGEMILPPANQTGVESSEVYAQSSEHYVETRLDARILVMGESLILTELEPKQFRSSCELGSMSTVVTCHSNMEKHEFVHKTWSGRLHISLSYDATDTRNCDKTSTSRVLNFQSVEKPSSGSGVKEGELKFPPDGQLPPTEGMEMNWQVIVTPEGGGFGVNITVQETNLKADLGDSLYINPGNKRDTTNGVLLSWVTNSKTNTRELRFLTADSFFVSLRLGKRDPPQNMTGIGFRLTYSNTEPVTDAPTTVPTTTPLPTAPANVSDSIQVFVEGPTPEEFLAQIGDFNASVANMANTFCAVENIATLKPVEPDDVQIYTVTRCPFSWPNWQHCTSIVFGVPVFTVDTTSYELTAANLERMWISLSEEHLPVTMSMYEVPNSSFWWWIGVTFGILILVILLIILVWRIDVYHSMNRYKRPESLMGSGSTNGSLSGPAGRGDILPHQIVPPYMMAIDYEDERRGSINEGMVNTAYHDDEDDEIDLFTQEKMKEPDMFGSDTDEEIVEAVGPPRRDLIYDTPSETSSVRHVKLEGDTKGETVL